MEQLPEPSPRGTFLSLFLMLICGGGFLAFLVLVSGGFFLYVGLAVLAVGSVGYLHYLLWGQAMTEQAGRERASDPERSSADSEHIWRAEDRFD